MLPPFHVAIFFLCWLSLAVPPAASGDDSCAFGPAERTSLRVVVLFDNGPEMEQILSHPAYDATTDYTPSAANREEGVNGFFNDGGYLLLRENSRSLSLQPVLQDLTLADSASASTSSLWSVNGRSLDLPSVPSGEADEEGIIDNARFFRYSKNYLNYLFFGPYSGDGSDLPASTRLHSAKAALLRLAKLLGGRAEFALFNFTGAGGASRAQPMKKVVEVEAEEPEESLLDRAFEGNILRMKTVDASPLAEGLVEAGNYLASLGDGGCTSDFLVLLSGGVSSEDRGDLWDYDGDGAPAGIGGVPVDMPGGASYLDDVARLLYRGQSSLRTLTLEVEPTAAGRVFLINTSNNGNVQSNIHDSGAPGYGRHHFRAEDPGELASFLHQAVRYREGWVAFAPPVISTSGDAIYLSDFRPGEGNLWQGRVRKFPVSAGGSLPGSSQPVWSTEDWSVPSGAREIYTYLGASRDLSSPGNVFAIGNGSLTEEILANPSAGRGKLIDFVRGMDVFDEDGDGDASENRDVIAADSGHGAPLIVDYGYGRRMVFFGANDGMLHAVDDRSGREAWAFIPPDQLGRLKLLIEGREHPFFIDSSARAFVEDVDGDGILEPNRDRVILVCGERKGGSSYFALDVTSPERPLFLWRIAGEEDAALPPGSGPDLLLPELGESWAEPAFGRVRDSGFEGFEGGKNVLFLGGGAFYVIDLYGGVLLRKFALDDRVVSAAKVLDGDGNGFVDKVYFGDLGGNLWRLGLFGSSFPRGAEDLESWRAQILFSAGGRMFYHPPEVTLERGFDLLFVGTGNREEACDVSSDDRIYAIRDDHRRASMRELDLVDVTEGDVAGEFPLWLTGRTDADGNGRADRGWFLRLPPGEKVLSGGTVVAGVYHAGVFAPSENPCLPGSTKLYSLEYRRGGGAPDLEGDGDGVAERVSAMGRGIGSGPVPLFGEESTRVILHSGEGEAGATLSEVEAAPGAARVRNLRLLWWKEVF